MKVLQKAVKFFAGNLAVSLTVPALHRDVPLEITDLKLDDRFLLALGAIEAIVEV